MLAVAGRIASLVDRRFREGGASTLATQILQDWRRQGYPFGHLVPSYGSAVGSSGDRPDALVDLMGLILNDGVRQPNVDLQRLHFAADTPYETEMTLQPEPQRVLAPEIARCGRR